MFENANEGANWWDFVYFRNYKLWNYTLSNSQILTSILDHRAMVLGNAGVVSFYKFANRDPFQVDYANSNWIMEPERAYLQEFVDANHYFNREVDIPNEAVKPYQVKEILHLYHSRSNVGPTLNIPISSLKETSSFSVELWFAFRRFGMGNFSILGMSDRAWDQGFAISGVMTGDAAILSCLLDTKLNSPMEADGCYTDTSLCQKVSEPHVWHHITCTRYDFIELIEHSSRSESDHNTNTGTGTRLVAGIEANSGTEFISELGSELGPRSELGTQNNGIQITEVESTRGELIINDIQVSFPGRGANKYKANIGELFSPGKLILGRKDEDRESFDGYVREIRIWSRNLNMEEINSMRHMQLNPLVHGTLIAYWPLINGNPYQFFEVTDHFITNPEFPNKKTASEWVNAGVMPILSICPPKYIYHSDTTNCIPTFKHLGIYIDSAATNCGGSTCNLESDKRIAGKDDFTFSLWVYHTKLVEARITLIGIEKVAELHYIKEDDNGYLRGKYKGAYGKVLAPDDECALPPDDDDLLPPDNGDPSPPNDGGPLPPGNEDPLSPGGGEPSPTNAEIDGGEIDDDEEALPPDECKTINLAYVPPLGKWIFYAFVIETTDDPQMHFFYDGKYESATLSGNLDPMPSSTVFIIGKGLHGYIREVKIWTKSLIKDGNMINLMLEKHL